MARKEGRDAAILRADQEARRADRLSQALNAVMRHELLAVLANERHPAYKFHVCNLTGATGGLFITVFAPGGQRPSTDVELLDDAAQWAREYVSLPNDSEMLARRSAIETARAMRQRVLDGR